MAHHALLRPINVVLFFLHFTFIFFDFRSEIDKNVPDQRGAKRRGATLDAALLPVVA